MNPSPPITIILLSPLMRKIWITFCVLGYAEHCLRWSGWPGLDLGRLWSAESLGQPRGEAANQQDMGHIQPLDRSRLVCIVL